MVFTAKLAPVTSWSVPYDQMTEKEKTRTLLTGDSDCCAEHCSVQAHPEVFVLSEILVCGYKRALLEKKQALQQACVQLFLPHSLTNTSHLCYHRDLQETEIQEEMRDSLKV